MSQFKKLIEVALPLEDINAASAHEKMPGIGAHPRGLHLWWARRPLAAARAVIFAQMVDDPSAYVDELWEDAGLVKKLGKQLRRKVSVRDRSEAHDDILIKIERERLFDLIRQLVLWENTTNERVLEEARQEIRKSWRRTCRREGQPEDTPLPGFHDPFAGGGAIPLEAQRLGFEAHASDLNPVAVLINKAMIEIPPKFANLPPVHPEARNESREERNEERIERSEERVSKAVPLTSHSSSLVSSRTHSSSLFSKHALQGDNDLAEGDGSDEGTLPARAASTKGRDLRDAVSDNAGNRVHSGEHRRGLDEGVGQGKGAVSSSGSGLTRGGGDAADALRADRMVPGDKDDETSGIARRGEPNADNAAEEVQGDEVEERVERSEERVSKAVPLTSHSSSPVSSRTHSSSLFPHTWRGASGLAEDVRRYGAWMREVAFMRIGHLYPPVIAVQYADGTYRHATKDEITVGRPLTPHSSSLTSLTVIAWIWARTVKSPNPAVSHVDVPLASTFILSSKAGKEAYVQPVIEGDRYRFEVKMGKPPAEAKEGTKLSRGAHFKCVVSGSTIPSEHIYSEAMAQRMGAKLMAVVAEGSRGRVYLDPSEEMERVAALAKPTWKPELPMPENPRWFSPPLYGLTTYGDLFTPRQLVALTTFSDLVGEARERIERDALAAGMPNDGKGLEAGGTGAKAYAEAVSVYLAFAVDRCADFSNSVTRWVPGNQKVMNLFGKQAIAMTWDYPEAAILEKTVGGFEPAADFIAKCLLKTFPRSHGISQQADAQTQSISSNKVISTDPPYYDNIGYADLSDFFYVWLRKSLSQTLPSLFSTISVPKTEELVATPYRHGNKQKAEKFFLDGMTLAIKRFASLAHPVAPLTIYYAFKQSETKEGEGTISPGWVSFLGAVQQAGLEVVGTWPVRSEQGYRMIGIGTNALASSVVLVCRKRLPEAPMATRREFVQALQRELPKALIDLQHGNIAPVDLPQSSIGPGMGIFSRYAKVVESDGKPMSVRTALQLINQAVDEFLSEQEAQMDDWTRFAITWFNQFGFQQGAYGDAQNIATARNVTVEGVRDAGILETGGGKVRLLGVDELEPDWSPTADTRCTVWEVVHHLIKRLNEGGEEAAAKLLKEVGGLGEDARALCYRLYTLCEQKKWADEARAYNTLIGVWPGLTKLSDNLAITGKHTQSELGL